MNGRVIDRRGKGVSGATILARVMDAKGPPPVQVLSDAEGAFAITSIAPEHELLVVTHPEYAGTVSDLPISNPTLVLSAGGEVSGHVLLNGQPQQAHVNWNTESSLLSGSAPCDADGVFHINRMPPGEVELATYLRFEEGAPSLKLSQQVTVREGMTTEADLSGSLGNAAVVVDSPAESTVRRSVRILQVNDTGATQTTLLSTDQGRERVDTLLPGPATVETRDADGRVVSSLELMLVEGSESVTRIPVE